MAATNTDVIWWDEDDPHQKLIQLCRKIDNEQGSRRALNVHHLRLYADRDLYGSTGVSWRSTGAGQRLATTKPKLSINIVRNMVNAATSMITRSKPRPLFLTSGGDWDLQQKAKRRGYFAEAVFNQENTYDLGARVVQHGHILGTGALKIVRDYAAKKVRHELCYIGEIVVDEAEGIYGTPRNYFQIRAVDKLVLKELYGDQPGFQESFVDNAHPSSVTPRSANTTEQVIVVEGWHLPSGEDAGDGRYAVVTDAGTLFEDEYKWDAPPFAFYRWEEDPLGFYGTGLPSELAGIQYEINETIRNMQANWWAGGNLKVLVERGAKIVKAHLNNDVRGTIVEYTGRPPTWMTTDAVAPGLMQYLQFLIENAFNQSGISQLSAQQQTPAASMSGRARLVQENSESLRFLPAQRRHERFYMDVTARTMEAATDIYEQEGDFEVLFKGKDYLDPVKYSEIQAGTDVYEIQCTPTSIMPSTPGGKLDFTERLEARGYIDASQAKKLMDFPDLRQELDFDEAPIQLIDKRLYDILNRKQYVPPHPAMDLQLCLNRSLKAIMLAEERNVPDAIVEKLREWRDTAQAYLDQANKPPEQVPAPPPAGGPPTGPGFPAPNFPGQVPMPPETPIAPGPPIPQQAA